MLLSVARFKQEHRAVAGNLSELLQRKLKIALVVEDIDELQLFALMVVVALSALDNKDIAGTDGIVLPFQVVQGASAGNNGQFSKIVAVLQSGQIVGVGELVVGS